MKREKPRLAPGREVSQLSNRRDITTKHSKNPERPTANTIDERLCGLEIKRLSKQANREYEKLGEASDGDIFLGSPAFLSETVMRGEKIVSRFGRNMLTCCRKVWRRSRGGTTSESIRKKLLPRILLAVTGLAQRIRSRISRFPFHPQDLEMGLSFFDERIVDLKEEITDGCESEALKLEKREVRAGPATPRPSLTEKVTQGKMRAGRLASNRQQILRPILEEKGWSQLKLSDQAKLTHRTVGRFLSGQSNPRNETRKQMADALGMKLTDFPQ